MNVFGIDLSVRPNVYRTSNPDPKRYGRIFIDFQPETVPTIGPFNTTKEVMNFLREQFGKKQVALWFPGGVLEIPELEQA